MPFRSMQQGISAIQQGNLVEGARLLKIALKSHELQGSMRATTLMWLAETKATVQEKTDLYREALTADPENENAKQRLAQMLAMDLPPVPGGTPSQASFPATAPVYAQPARVQQATAFYRTVGVYNGPNGPGTGFFVTRDGLVATTRFVTGGAEQLIIELEAGRQTPGTIVRAFPELDLALIHTGIAVSQLLPVTASPTVPDNTPLTCLSHTGHVMNGQRRSTQSKIKPEWFPTTINAAYDAGGNPVLDDRANLVGMLTRNANRTSPYVFVLHVSAIFRCVEQYMLELRDAVSRTYCPGCGGLSRAAGLGGYYCELCGSTLPTARNINRFPLPVTQVETIYGENTQRPCNSCGSRAGYYDGYCLRCGRDGTEKRRR